MLRAWHRLARDIGCTISEARERVTLNEFRSWCAFYGWEAEQTLPPDKRPRRPRDKESACKELNRLFAGRIRKP